MAQKRSVKAARPAAEAAVSAPKPAAKPVAKPAKRASLAVEDAEAQLQRFETLAARNTVSDVQLSDAALAGQAP